MAVLEIDQSGKWESNTHTVIGVSIGGQNEFSSLITVQNKSTARKMVLGLKGERKKSKRKMIIRMFAYTIFLTIRALVRQGDIIVIDTEYEKNDAIIRDVLIWLFRRRAGMELDPKSIQFRPVGKESLAHKIAHSTFAYRRNPDKNIEPSEYYALLERTDEIRAKALMKRKSKNK